MINIFYSPHMTSVDNEAGRASGHVDVPLSEAGHERARELGQHYAARKVDAVFCSDMQRAVMTAQIAFEGRGVPIVADARLREYDYGEMTQYAVEQVEREFVRRVTEPFPGGESLVMVVERVGEFLRDVWSGSGSGSGSKYDGQMVVIIGHRGTRYGLEYWCEGVALEEIVGTAWPWLDVPIWHYELCAEDFGRGSEIGCDLL